jgi:hypothetical protein
MGHVTERRWRCSTAVGSAAYHSINCCGPLQSVECTVLPAAIALLVMTIIRDPILAAAYPLLFGIGTIGGMMFHAAANSSFRFHLGQSAKVQLATRSRIGLDQFCFWAVPRLRHRLRQWRPVHRQSEWATTLIGRAVQL